MKITIKGDTGLHEFADRPDGMVFFFTDDTAVKMLERPTGLMVTKTVKTLRETLSPKLWEKINADLLMSGIYTNKRFEIMLVE